MKQILPILLTFALSFTVLSQHNVSTQTTENLKMIVGRYVYSSGFVGAHYEITGDGKYEYSSFSDCCDPVWKESGNYELKDNVIHLKIIKKTLNNYNLLDPKEATEAYRKLYHYKGEDVRGEEIATEYSLLFVKWGERIYLIEPERLHLFIAAVNLGIEPRTSIINENYLTARFYLQSEDAHKAASGKPTLPKEAMSYLLDSPIRASIEKIELEGKENLYVINKGNADGLKVGMCLVGENVEADYDNLLWVESVEEHTAKLRGYTIFRAVKYQTGNILTTKSKRKMLP